MKRKLAILLALATLLVCFQGMAMAENAETLELTIYTEDRGYDRSQLLNEIAVAEKFNFKFNFIVNTNDVYTEKLRLLMMIDETPDMMMIRSPESNMTDMLDEGVLFDFAPYLEDMPNLQAAMTNLEGGKNIPNYYNGHVYSFSRCAEMCFTYSRFFARTDILEKNSLSTPTTFDELYDVCKQLKAIYPDSTPLGASTNMMSFLAMSFRTGWGVNYNQDADAWVYEITSENFKAMIEWFSKMYAEGLVEKEYATISEASYVERLVNGTYFFGLDYPYFGAANLAAGVAINPEYRLEGIAPLTNTLGTAPLIAANYPVSYGINFAVANNDKVNANLDRILEFVDWRFSEDCMLYSSYGVQGVTYDLDENGNPYLLPSVKTPSNPEGTIDATSKAGLDVRCAVWGRYSLKAEDAQWSNAELLAANEIYNVLIDQIQWVRPSISITTEINETISNIMTPVKTYADEMIAKFATGIEPMSNWDGFIENIASYGDYQKVADIYNELRVEQGAEPIKPY